MLMKKLFLSLMFLSLVAAKTDAQSVRYRHDKSNYQTFRNMELPTTGWSWRGTPAESDWYSTYKKKIDLGLFSIKVTVPGNGWHDNGYWGWGYNIVPNMQTYRTDWWFTPTNFVNQSYRKFEAHRLAALAESLVEKDNKESEYDYWQEMLEMDLAVMADKQGLVNTVTGGVVSAYDITSDLRNKAKEVIDAGLQAIDNPEVAADYAVEYLRLKSEIEVIKSSYILDASKLVELKSANDRLDALMENIKAYLKVREFQEMIDALAAGSSAGGPLDPADGRNCIDDLIKKMQKTDTNDGSSVINFILDQVDLSKL